MIYNKPHPRIDNVLWLSRLAMPFPTTADRVVQIARSWRFDQSTLDFLDLFPADEIFKSREDFLARSEELELLLREKSEMPAETVMSQQD